MVIEYIEAIDLGNAFVGLGLAFLLLIFGILMIKLLSPQSSKYYRKYLTNMYVAGKIKQYIQKENINLKEVEKDFAKYLSLSNRKRIKDLDEEIEEELMAKIKTKKEEEKA
jgi:hypothetical protein